MHRQVDGRGRIQHRHIVGRPVAVLRPRRPGVVPRLIRAIDRDQVRIRRSRHVDVLKPAIRQRRDRCRTYGARRCAVVNLARVRHAEQLFRRPAGVAQQRFHRAIHAGRVLRVAEPQEAIRRRREQVDQCHRIGRRHLAQRVSSIPPADRRRQAGAARDGTFRFGCSCGREVIHYVP